MWNVANIGVPSKLAEAQRMLLHVAKIVLSGAC